jgi:hypothetical protein
MEIEYIDERTLSLTKIKFSDKQVILAEDILKAFGKGVVFLSKDKKALVVNVDKSTSYYDKQHEKECYRIIIEKVVLDE